MRRSARNSSTTKTGGISVWVFWVISLWSLWEKDNDYFS